MKNIFMAAALVITFNSFASIEFEGRSKRPSESEISRNRECFEDLKVLGCGDPGEDPEQFRTCMDNVYQNLSPDCKALMTKLYR